MNVLLSILQTAKVKIGHLHTVRNTSMKGKKKLLR